MEISIVIPVFHPKETYLLALFDSIVSQTRQDFEIIISDDYKSESLIMTILPIALKSKTRYIQNAGKKGIFGNLNNGLRHTNGKYIQIFCQDDVMLPDLLRVNSIRLTENTELVFSHFDAISANNEVILIQRDEMQYIPSIISSAEANNYFLYFGCIPGNLSPVMFTKSLLEKTGLFEESYEYIGDFEFWIRAARYTNLYFNKEKQLLVRRHPESASSSLGTLQRFLELRQLLTYLMKNNSFQLPEAVLRQYLHLHVFKTVVLHSIRKALTFQPISVSQFRLVFDGKPFSMWLALLSFLSPIPANCKPLQQKMEVYRP